MRVSIIDCILGLFPTPLVNLYHPMRTQEKGAKLFVYIALIKTKQNVSVAKSVVQEVL